jgi:cytosine/adenosine deaminase-related metal-dependent hydrolase
LLEGKGVLKDLLIEKGLYDKNFSPPKKRPIPYLASLGLLDQKSLCVHCVEVNQADIEILQKYGAKICFCPRSNTYLGLKEAPWSLFRRVGVLSCLGTDSLASNTDLNLFNEMAYLFKKGAFSPTELIEMATWRGSLALGKNSQFGVLFAGAVARFLFIPLINTKINELGEAVIYMGTKERLRLIEHDSGDK